MTDIKEIIRKYALRNAIFYQGKCNPGSVLGKVLAENPDLRKDVAKVKKEVETLAKEVNKMSLEKQKEELEKIDPSLLEKKHEKQELKFPDLPKEVAKNLVSLFPPEPSKYPHIGHLKAAYINYYYAEKYKGKFILRFEDNNPELAKQEYVDATQDGIGWLGIKWDKIDYVSDHIDKFYKITEDLIKSGDAYLCTCDKEKTSKLRFEEIACEHRDQSVKVNKDLWIKMIEGKFKDGEITVRIKIDMAHQNTTMRDPSIMRLDINEHFRVGKKCNVWPLYDFATSVMDKFEGITFRVRSKEFEMRAPLQQHIQKLIGYKSPYVDEIARFNLEGAPASGREIRAIVQKGMGWDDPRLPTLAALRKRGFVADAIKEFLLLTGMSKAESTISWDVLNSINRKHIDSKSNRYFFIKNPIEITIEGLPEKKFAEANLHPDQPGLGKRKIYIGKKFYIEKEDFERLKGKEVRLLHLANVKLDKNAKYLGNEIKDIPKIHWVSDKHVNVKLVMNDASEYNGLAEPDFDDVNVGQHVQFERFGYVHVVSTKPLIVYFTHK